MVRRSDTQDCQSYRTFLGRAVLLNAPAVATAVRLVIAARPIAAFHCTALVWLLHCVKSASSGRVSVAMAQKSKKSKSKRMSLKQKYKIVKKVKEHHKKKAKEDKKTGRKQKAPKDPGIPSAWPFKADLLKELDWEKQRAVAVDKQRKEERKRARVSFAHQQAHGFIPCTSQHLA